MALRIGSEKQRQVTLNPLPAGRSESSLFPQPIDRYETKVLVMTAVTKPALQTSSIFKEPIESSENERCFMECLPDPLHPEYAVCLMQWICGGDDSLPDDPKDPPIEIDPGMNPPTDLLQRGNRLEPMGK